MESVVARARRRARSPPARARARVPFSTSHESTATRLAIDACRRSRCGKRDVEGTHEGGGTRGRVTTGGGGLFPPVAPVAGDGMGWAIARAG